MDGTYLFAAGGTGGHLFPAIAVARALLARHPSARVLFVGTERALERDILAREGFPHHPLPAASTAVLKRNPAGFAWRHWTACRGARRLLAEYRPAVVFGCGGFASVPPVLAASMAGIPILLLEQNASPGRATVWLSRDALGVCVAFEESVAALPRGVRSVVTGNPVRTEIAALAGGPFRANHGVRTLLVLGGSQGARSLNAAVTGACAGLATQLRGWRVVHQSGPDQDGPVRDRYAELGIDAVVAPFIDDMAAAYRAADLVISRAGATTLAELACAGRAAVLVPYPHAARDHQRHNADAFARTGAAVCVSERPDAGDTVRTLVQAVSPMLADEHRRETVSAAMRQRARPDAAQVVLAQLTSWGVPAAA
jgi:UDP-N-acetylglucosamine--N-acetylmuramyl-(pentapeptide) pyrophosphoryl-undecaprenol N-acetylglucosamine transferase